MLIVCSLIGTLGPESVQKPARSIFQHVEMVVETIPDRLRIAPGVCHGLFRGVHRKVVRDHVLVNGRIQVVPVEMFRPALSVVPCVTEMLLDRLIGSSVAMAGLGRFGI